MSSTDTNFKVNSNDLKNLFQINPNGPTSQTTLPPPYTIVGTSPFFEYTSGWYILTFNINSSITFIAGLTVYNIVVGGGGSGGSSGNFCSGGNGGSVFNGYFTSNTNAITITVGTGGNGVTGSTIGNAGNSSSIINNVDISVSSPGGNFGVNNTYWPDPQPPIIYTNNTVTAINFTPEYNITGGNFGDIPYLPSDGKNGIEVNLPPGSSRLEYYGGGGGAGNAYIGAAFGYGTGGNGGLGGGGLGGYVVYSNSLSPLLTQKGNGVNGRGGGGGGAASSSVGSGDGGDGVVIFYFKYP